MLLDDLTHALTQKSAFLSRYFMAHAISSPLILQITKLDNFGKNVPQSLTVNGVIVWKFPGSPWCVHQCPSSLSGDDVWRCLGNEFSRVDEASRDNPRTLRLQKFCFSLISTSDCPRSRPTKWLCVYKVGLPLNLSPVAELGRQPLGFKSAGVMWGSTEGSRTGTYLLTTYRIMDP